MLSGLRAGMCDRENDMTVHPYTYRDNFWLAVKTDDPWKPDCVLRHSDGSFYTTPCRYAFHHGWRAYAPEQSTWSIVKITDPKASIDAYDCANPTLWERFSRWGIDG